MADLTQKIKIALEQLTALEHAKRRHAEVKEIILKLNESWKVMDKQLDKELKDIQELEKLGVRSLFHNVLGSKEEELERERQEYLALNLKHKELVKSIEVAEFEEKVLAKKVLEIDVVERYLDKLMDLREKEILSTDDSLKDELVAVFKKMDEAIKFKEEIKQAFNAGFFALQSIARVLKYLKEAEKWGQWDMYNKSGYYDHLKHTAVDKAVDEAYRAKMNLTQYKNELADIGMHDNFALHVESFTKFTDIFFDNLISDWIVQRKIKNVLASVLAVQDKVESIQQILQKDFDEMDEKIQALEAQKNEILIK
jgi:hypothetical protein